MIVVDASALLEALLRTPAAAAVARVAAQWDRRLARIKRLAESVQAEAGIDVQHRQGEGNDRSQDGNS